MRYRKLRKDELFELETEFVRFLAANTVTADEWERLKKEQNDQAEKLIELFSDLVFQQTLEKIEYLQRRAPKDLQTFHCLPDKILLRGLRVEGPSEVDFTRNETPAQMMEQVRASSAELQVYRAEKAYSKVRELELFEMMEQGCLISKGEMFGLLDQL